MTAAPSVDPARFLHDELARDQACESSPIFAQQGDQYSSHMSHARVSRGAILMGVAAVATVLATLIAVLSYFGLQPQPAHSSGATESPSLHGAETPTETEMDASDAQAQDAEARESSPTTNASRPEAMPDVTGMSWTEARRVMGDIPFDVQESFDAKNTRDAHVIEQVPSSGEPVTGAAQLTVARQYLSTDVQELAQTDNFRFSGPSTYSVDGVQYDNSYKVFSQYSSASIEWNLARDFDVVVGVIGLSDEHASGDAVVRVEIKADGLPIRTESVSLGQPVHIEESIESALRLEIGVNATSGSSAHLVLADLRLLTKPGPLQ